MFGKIIGAIAGAKASKATAGVNGPAGALIGAATVAVVRRVGLPVLVAAAAGGYALKRLSEKHSARAKPAAGKSRPRPAKTAA